MQNTPTPLEDFSKRVATFEQRARVATWGLCPDCARDWSDWLDYRELRPIRLVAIGGDLSARAMLESQKAHADKVYDTIRWQQNLIRRICTIRHDWRPDMVVVELPQD